MNDFQTDTVKRYVYIYKDFESYVSELYINAGCFRGAMVKTLCYGVLVYEFEL